MKQRTMPETITAYAATLHHELLKQIMDPNVYKNEREWAAAREIAKLHELLREASVYVPLNDLGPITLPDRIRNALEPPQ